MKPLLHTARLAFAGLALTAGLSACASAPSDTASPVWMAQVAPGAPLLSKNVESWREQKFHDLVRQNTDFSCGAAAVATIFNYAYGKHTSEQQVLVNMMKVSDAELVRTKGFSLLDMKNYVEAIGMQGQGYEVTYDQLADLRVPAIVLLDIRGYKHFVVLRKTVGDQVYIGDPALGNRVMWRGEFEESWNGIVFAILGADYDAENVLINPPEPLSAARLYALRSPVPNAEIYDFGLGPSYSFIF